MTVQSAINTVFVAACLAVAPLAGIAQESGTPPPGANMMGHSPASKEHTLMKRKPSQTPKSGQPGPSP